MTVYPVLDAAAKRCYPSVRVRIFALLLLAVSAGFSESTSSISPVRSSLARFLGIASPASDIPLDALTSRVEPGQRPPAKAALDSLDRSRLSLEQFGELTRAYVLLGFPEAADVASAGFPESDPRRAWGLSQAASAAAARSEYAEAVRLANEALRLKPGDPVALATLRLAEGRGRTTPSASPDKPPRDGLPPAPERPSERAPLMLSEPPKRRSLSDSAIPTLKMLDDETAAPEATLTDRAMAFITPSKQLVESDLRKMRALLVGFELPDETMAIGSTNFSAPKQFVSWIRSAPDSELAPISYEIIDAGLLGEYDFSALTKGEIRLNHFIRSAEPEGPRHRALARDLPLLGLEGRTESVS